MHAAFQVVDWPASGRAECGPGRKIEIPREDFALRADRRLLRDDDGVTRLHQDVLFRMLAAENFFVVEGDLDLFA